MNCPYCGAPLPDTAIMCYVCKSRFADAQKNKPDTNGFEDASKYFDILPIQEDNNASSTLTGQQQQAHGQSEHQQRQNNSQNNEQNYGQSNGQIYRQNTGQIYGQSYGQNNGQNNDQNNGRYQQQGNSRFNANVSGSVNNQYQSPIQRPSQNQKQVNSGAKKPAGCFTNLIKYIGLAIIGLAILGAGIAVLSKNKKNDSSGGNTTNSNSSSSSSSASSNSNSAVSKQTESGTTTSKYSFTTAKDSKNMGLGEIGNDNGLYIKLSHAKKANQIVAYANTTYSPAKGNKVVFLFFDMFNGSSDIKSIYSSRFTCYADGVQVKEVETSFLYSEDGVNEELRVDLDEETATMFVCDFEVPENWKELKIYYESACVWSVKNDEVTEKPYDGSHTFTEYNQKSATQEGSVVYSGKYELKYDGWEYHEEGRSRNKTNYLIVKFTVTNSGDEELKYTLTGYNMRAFRDNYYVSDASYMADDKVGDYINVFDIDSIQPGMSAKLYIAIETDDVNGLYHVVFDDGYMQNDALAHVYFEDKK